jgi:RHH-type proline utilization regulon transcriptional repressor/proline dehydrogenase/delta 1-pyrroline-5-carboxylate dehydrogenase
MSSSFHLTECFGPVLGLMRSESFGETIVWKNQTPCGLTAGLHSLDPAEVALTTIVGLVRTGRELP